MSYVLACSGGFMMRKFVTAGLVASMMLSLGCWSNKLESGSADLLSLIGLDGNVLPRVASVSPENNSTGIATDVVIQARFNKAIDPASISASTVTLADRNNNPVSGTVAYDAVNWTATFTPGATLDMLSSYTATVSAAVADLQGNTLGADFTWRFTTVAAGTVPAPEFNYLSGPYTGPLDVTISCTETGAVIWYTTNGSDPASGVGTPITGGSGTVTVSTNMIFRAIAVLSGWNDSSITSRTYTILPAVTSVSPANGDAGVAVSSVIEARFSKSMDGTSINTSTFTLTDSDSNPVSGTVTYDALTWTAIFTPGAALDGLESYTATVTAGVRDLEGNGLAADYTWVFSTAALGTVSNPVLNPGSGTYPPNQLILVTCGTASAEIWYTTDGVTDPAQGVGTQIGSGDYISLPLPSTITIRAIAILDGWNSSPIVQQTYIILPEYAVTYNPNGATGSTTTTFYLAGSNVTVQPNSFTRPGYIFVGWNTQPNGTGADYQPGNTFTINNNIYLYAQWATDNLAYNMYAGGYSVNAGSVTSGNVVIPATYNGLPVVAIEDAGFDGLTGLTGITIGPNVATIGIDAFNGCSGITSIVIPDSVTSIGTRAFRNCTSAANLTIGSGVVSIGQYAFYYCNAITGVALPNSVTSIGDYAFCDCTSMASVTIPNSVTSIGLGAFLRCTSLTAVTIPDSVTIINNYTFSGSGLINVAIPNTVTGIGEQAFADCNSLVEVTLGSAVTFIDNYAFHFCENLATVNAKPENPPTTQANIFNGDTGLLHIYVPSPGSVALYQAATGWLTYAGIISN